MDPRQREHPLGVAQMTSRVQVRRVEIQVADGADRAVARGSDVVEGDRAAVVDGVGELAYVNAGEVAGVAAMISALVRARPYRTRTSPAA